MDNSVNNHDVSSVFVQKVESWGTFKNRVRGRFLICACAYLVELTPLLRTVSTLDVHTYTKKIVCVHPVETGIIFCNLVISPEIFPGKSITDHA